MDLTHIRTENGTTTLITTRAALDEIEAGMVGPTKRDVRQMSAVRSSANIEYRDGRKVDIRPATVQAVRAMADAAQARVTADPDATNPEWNAALAQLSAALDYLAVMDPLYAEATATTETIAPEDIRPGDTIEALNTSSTNPQTFRVTVDRTPWRVNPRTTALTDGQSMYDAQTASLCLISRQPSAPDPTPTAGGAMTKLMYRVTATGSRGSRYGSDSTALDPQALADQLAADTRTARPDLAGPLTIHVWPARDDEHYRLPIPADAQRFDYPAA